MRVKKKNSLLTRWWSVWSYAGFEHQPKIWTFLCFLTSYCVTAQRRRHWETTGGQERSLKRGTQRLQKTQHPVSFLQQFFKGWNCHLLKRADSTVGDKGTSFVEPSEQQTNLQHLQQQHRKPVSLIGWNKKTAQICIYLLFILLINHLCFCCSSLPPGIFYFLKLLFWRCSAGVKANQTCKNGLSLYH